MKCRNSQSSPQIDGIRLRWWWQVRFVFHEIIMHNTDQYKSYILFRVILFFAASQNCPLAYILLLYFPNLFPLIKLHFLSEKKVHHILLSPCFRKYTHQKKKAPKRYLCNQTIVKSYLTTPINISPISISNLVNDSATSFAHLSIWLIDSGSYCSFQFSYCFSACIFIIFLLIFLSILKIHHLQWDSFPLMHKEIPARPIPRSDYQSRLHWW